MSKKNIILLVSISIITFYSYSGYSTTYSVYNISQDIPMGEKDEILAKNYYVNIGQLQGIQPGTILDVYRTISSLDPYSNNIRYNHDVKIGELLVVHSEKNSSITSLKQLIANTNIYFEIDSVIIGDQVQVKTTN